MPEEPEFTEEERDLLLKQFNTEKREAEETPVITEEQKAEKLLYGPPLKNSPSYYEYNGIADPNSGGEYTIERKEAVDANVAYWVNKAIEDQENELTIPENDFVNEHVVPMAYRVGAPVAYPAVARGAAAAAKWSRRMQAIKNGKLLTRNAGKSPTPWTIASFVAGEITFGIAGEYAAQKHLIANEYQDEIQPGHLVSAGVVNSFTLRGLTKVGDMLPQWLRAYPEGTKMTKWAKALNTTKVYGGYAIRGGTVGAVSASIDQSYEILSDEEKAFLEDWNWEYFGKAALAGAGVDASLNLTGRAAKKAATSKLVRNSKTFKKGVALHNKVVATAREKEIKSIRAAVTKMDKKIAQIEKELGPTLFKGGADETKKRNLIQNKWFEATGQRNKLKKHLEDATDVFTQTAVRLNELETIALKKLKEDTYKQFLVRQKRIPQFEDIRGMPVKPNIQGELVLYKVEGQQAKPGQVILTTQRPKKGKATVVSIPQANLKLLEPKANGSVVFTTQKKQFEAALNKTSASTKVVLGADPSKTKITPEDKSNVERLIRSKTANTSIDPAQHAQDVKNLQEMVKSTLGDSGDVAVLQSEIYQRFFPYVKHLIERLPKIKSDDKAVDDVLDILNKTMEMEAATGGVDFKTATSMLAMKEMTPQEALKFNKQFKGRTIGLNSLRRQADLQALKKAVEDFKATRDMGAVEEAAEAVAGSSRQIQRQNKAKAKQAKKNLENKYQEVVAKVVRLHNGTKGPQELTPIDAIVDGVLQARTASLLAAPDTALLGTVNYVIQGLVVQPAKQTGINVVKAFGWGSERLKDASIGQRLAYALTDTPLNISRNNYYLQHILALTTETTSLKNALNTFKTEGRSTLLPRASGYLDTADPSQVLSRRELIYGKRLARKEESPGVGGLLFKRAPKYLADEVNSLIKIPGTVLGAADEPFFYALTRANLATEAQRLTTELNIPKAQRANFIKDYVERQFLKEGKLTTINESAEAIKAANQALRSMGRGPKYGEEGVDYRLTAWEKLANAGGKSMNIEESLVKSATMRVRFPVFGIPVRLSGQSIDFLFSPGTASLGVGARVAGEKAGLGRLGPYRTSLNKADKKLKEGNQTLEQLKQTGTPEQVKQTELSLAAERNKLNQTLALRNEEVAGNAGKAALALGVFAIAWQQAENAEITGTGSFLTAAQKKALGFKPFRFGGSETQIEGVTIPTGEGGSDLRYSDRIKMGIAFAADLKLWTEMKSAGLLTKDNPQTFDQFIAGWVTPAFQEQNVANTLNAIADIAVGAPGEREAAIRRTGASFTMVPSFFRKYQQIDAQQYQQDITQGPIISASFKYGAGLDTENYKRDLFLRKVEKESITPLGFLIRSAYKQAPSADALTDIVRRDSLLADGGALSRQGGRKTIKQAVLTDFIQEGGQETLYQVYADLVNNIEHPDYGGKTQEEALFDLIDTAAWKKKYNDGYYTQREEGEEGLPFNEGINEINKVRRSFLKLAEEQLLDESQLIGGAYRNKKEENIYQFLYNLREE